MADQIYIPETGMDEPGIAMDVVADVVVDVVVVVYVIVVGIVGAGAVLPEGLNQMDIAIRATTAIIETNETRILYKTLNHGIVCFTAMNTPLLCRG